jgi:hypothetical protein
MTLRSRAADRSGTARPEAGAWPAVLTAGAAVGLGLAALDVTVVGREPDNRLEFVVVAPSALRLVVTALAATAAVIFFHVLGHRVPAIRASRAFRSGTYAVPLLAFVLPAAGLAAAMWGGWAASPLVYWCLELAPVWLTIAVASSVARLVVSPAQIREHPAATVRRVPAWAGYLALAAAAIGWIVVSNPSLRVWRGPLGDEPRYLRYLESWSQGRGVDISRVSRLADMPRDEPPRLISALGLAARTLATDAACLVRDTRSSLSDPHFTWDRMTAGDGSFVTGRGGGVFQSHQPGLSLLLLPGYAVDRWVFSTGTVYDGQFPDRLPLLHATLLLIAGMGAVGVAVLARRIGLGLGGAAAAGFLAWASFPASAMALQIYPETAAALAIVTTFALLSGGSSAWPVAALVGGIAGFPWLLHLRFVLVSAVLLLFGLWSLRRSRRAAAAFFCGWCGPVGAQVWFVYHATGIPWPTAFYRTADADLVRAASVPTHAILFLFDRDWGVVAHAPVVVLAFGGLAALWRVRRDLALGVAGVAAALLFSASTHNVAAGGGTPCRLITGMMPILFLPIAAVVHERRADPLVRALVLLLVVVTLDQAWAYNRSTAKEIGMLVAQGASGWRPNLLLPYLSDGFTPSAVRALLGAVAATVLLTAFLARRPSAAAWHRRETLRAAAIVIIALATVTTTAGAWQLSHPRYRYREHQARDLLVRSYVRAGDCSGCWSSLRGPIAPEDLGANALGELTLTPIETDGQRVRFRLDAHGPDGPVFGTVRFAYGDGSVRGPLLVFGTVEAEHRYAEAGEFTATAWLNMPGDTPRVAAAQITIPGAASGP